MPIKFLSSNGCLWLFTTLLQVGPGCMLDDWEENLAIISANRTKGDELVITHLGDCIWRERGEVWCRAISLLLFVGPLLKCLHDDGCKE